MFQQFWINAKAEKNQFFEYSVINNNIEIKFLSNSILFHLRNFCQLKYTDINSQKNTKLVIKNTSNNISLRENWKMSVSRAGHKISQELIIRIFFQYFSVGFIMKDVQENKINVHFTSIKGEKSERDRYYHEWPIINHI